MQRLRGRGISILGSITVPHIKKKALNSWSAVQDTFFSTKDIFERHRVVFTIGTSIASVATAWIGYSMRHYHESKVDQRLESIERAMKRDYHLGREEFKKLAEPGSSTASLMATAGTSLAIGYGLGWRGGRWYATRKFKSEQMKLLGQVKPRRLQLLGQIKARGLPFQFLRGPLMRSKLSDGATKTAEKKVLKGTPSTTHNPAEVHQSC